VLLQDQYGNYSEIDVCFGWIFKTFIECKNYSNKPVPLSDVAKFKEVLNLNNISPSRGIFITTGTYSPRAGYIGIRTIDGEQLNQLEKWSYVFSTIRTVTILCIFGTLCLATYYYYDHPNDFHKHYNIVEKNWKKLVRFVT